MLGIRNECRQPSPSDEMRGRGSAAESCTHALASLLEPNVSAVLEYALQFLPYNRFQLLNTY